MGANQSSRNITVVNDEATGVIKISDSVVQRLKGWFIKILNSVIQPVYKSLIYF